MSVHYVGVLKGKLKAVVIQYKPMNRSDMYKYEFGPFEDRKRAERLRDVWNEKLAENIKK